MRLQHGNAARDALVRGAQILARAVGATLGPSGKIVLIDDKFGKVIATKDGVTVARSITLPHNEENMGAKMLADAALRVAEECGDGTTTCVVIAAKLLELSQRLVGSGVDPSLLASQIRRAHKAAESELWRNSQPITAKNVAATIALVANVSCNGDQRAVDAVVAAYRHVGIEGVVLLREGDTDRTEVLEQVGMRIERGWNINALAPSDDSPIEFEDVAVLVAHRTISSAREIAPCMQVAADRKCSLLVVCEHVIGEAQKTLIGNSKSAALRCATVIPPGFDDRQWSFLQDLAVWCGATVQDLATAPLKPEMMGYVRRFRQDRKSTVLSDPMSGDQESLAIRITALENQRAKANHYDRDKLTERIGRLRGRVATISVGAPTPVEAREIKDRIEDGINAVRVSFHDGIQPGGGTALRRASATVQHLGTAGATILAQAMREPAAKIMRNAGDDGSLHAKACEIDSLTSWANGLDATGLECSMLSFPDPTKVVIGALRAAVSTVTTMLLAETSVSQAD